MAMFSGMMRGMGGAVSPMMGGGAGGGNFRQSSMNMLGNMRPQNRPMGGGMNLRPPMRPPMMGPQSGRPQQGPPMQPQTPNGGAALPPTGLGPSNPPPPIQPQTPNGGAGLPPQMYTPPQGGMDPTPGGANVTDMLPQQPPQDAMDMINRMKQPPQMGPFGGPQRFPGGGRGNFWDMQNRGGGGGIAPSWLQNMRSQGGM